MDYVLIVLVALNIILFMIAIIIDFKLSRIEKELKELKDKWKTRKE